MYSQAGMAACFLHPALLHKSSRALCGRKHPSERLIKNQRRSLSISVRGDIVKVNRVSKEKSWVISFASTSANRTQLVLLAIGPDNHAAALAGRARWVLCGHKIRLSFAKIRGGLCGWLRSVAYRISLKRYPSKAKTMVKPVP